jgi:hypothetical protein
MLETKTDECVELKNIKYKAMLQNGGAIVKETKFSNDMSNLDKFLENEKNNSNEPWSKLNNNTKTQKLLNFSNTFKKDKHLSDEDEIKLNAFLKDCLNTKKLQRVKDVTYDKVAGVIKDIPAFCFNKTTKHFTFKNTDKHISTLKSLPTKKIKIQSTDDLTECVCVEI